MTHYSVLFVVRCRQTTDLRKEQLYRRVSLPYVPSKDMDFQYEDGWGLSAVNYIYADIEGNFEVGLSAQMNEEDQATLIATGHWSYTLP